MVIFITLGRILSFSVQNCICRNCNKRYTVGNVYDDKCWYIEDRSPNKHHMPVRNISNKGQLQVFHIVTRRFYKKFFQQTISLKLNLRQFSDEYIRFPSVSLANLKCPVYDTQTNILYDDWNVCVNRPQYSVTDKYSIIPSIPSNKTFCDNSCFVLKKRIKMCQIVSINTIPDYKILEQYAMKNKQKTNTFIVKYDQNSVSLNMSDYFMHVSSYNKFKEPFSCHQVDALSGKIFQLPECSTLNQTKYLCYKHNKRCTPQMCTGDQKVI